MLSASSRTSLSDENKEIHEIVSNHAEFVIQDTCSDVLVIFDCCNAGEMDRGVRGAEFSDRAFEFIAAASHGSATRKPGPHSFTKALIWAFKQTIHSKPGQQFSRTELVKKISDAPHFGKQQSSKLIERVQIPCLRKIALAPLDIQPERVFPEGRSTERMSQTKDIFNLQFVFNKKINKPLIKHLSKYLSELKSRGNCAVST